MTLPEPPPAFPFPLEAVRGSQAATRLAELRREHAGSGKTPVILGDRSSVGNLQETFEFNREDPAPANLPMETPERWFETHMAEDPEACEGLDDDEFHPASAAPMHALAVGHDHKNKEIPEIWIALVDAAYPWDLPLALGYGAWNSCPAPGEHALVANYWFEKYGAEIAVMTSDTIEFTVARPPTDPEDCSKLAREMYIYCSDIVDQGVGSVPTLAKCLEGSTVWFFWWD